VPHNSFSLRMNYWHSFLKFSQHLQLQPNKTINFNIFLYKRHNQHAIRCLWINVFLKVILKTIFSNRYFLDVNKCDVRNNFDIPHLRCWWFKLALYLSNMYFINLSCIFLRNQLFLNIGKSFSLIVELKTANRKIILITNHDLFWSCFSLEYLNFQLVNLIYVFLWINQKNLHF